ncbi:MAG: ribosome biogenesis GTPase Der [bacterium]|nr:ribosome biogenesis GTPase Der [bacterium]
MASEPVTEEATTDAGEGPRLAVPTVAVVGRPNVGKSTLVNRIIGRREAIVEERPGVTRDRKEWNAAWLGRPFVVVDTGGWQPDRSGELAALDRKVSEQSRRAMLEADLAVLVTDVTTGVTEPDHATAEVLWRRSGPVLVAVNKVDDEGREPLIWEFVTLGLGDPHPISALHGRGCADLLDSVVAGLPEGGDGGDGGDGSITEGAALEDETATVSVAIVGRPNVGKSTLFNRLVGEERSVTHDMPGTTRDSVDTLVQTPLGQLRLVDTAGLRRRSRIDTETEYYAMLRALRSVDRADVVLLMVDSTQGITHQDQRLAERIDGAGCPILLLLNKWDLLEGPERLAIREQVTQRLGFLSGSPTLGISAHTGRGVNRILENLGGTVEQYRRRIPTRAVNRAIREAQAAHPAPGGARVLYATQGATDPPTFTLFVNRRLPATYLRYLQRRIGEIFDLGAVPVKFHVRFR